MTATANPVGVELRIASANLQEGGVDKTTGSDIRWQKTIDALTAWNPHIVLLQEMRSASPEHTLRRHLHRTANALGMTAILGPVSPEPGSANYPAILVTKGLVILDDGPWPQPGAPPWCHALVQVPYMLHPLRVYSVHLPARSATSQLAWAEYLANRIAQLGELTIAGGDWNGFSCGDADQLTPKDLARLPPHLIPPRMRLNDLGERLSNYDVHQVLDSVGLVDAAAYLPADRREPGELTPTADCSVGRIDRFYTTLTLAAAMRSYRQQSTGGSDHHAILLTLDLAAAAAAVPSETLP
jgi:endonuclease/exonuclease/phosphatase family metal-dependent hydrolase